MIGVEHPSVGEEAAKLSNGCVLYVADNSGIQRGGGEVTSAGEIEPKRGLPRGQDGAGWSGCPIRDIEQL